jgi:hypothetical protein
MPTTLQNSYKHDAEYRLAAQQSCFMTRYFLLEAYGVILNSFWLSIDFSYSRRIKGIKNTKLRPLLITGFSIPEL